jgi:5-methylcytosine-specific restriction endonuclease McrA
MRDRRYSTARWQKLRRAVLNHYGHTCQLQQPGCTVRATSVHHLVPSSEAPHLFWSTENLVPACSSCNSSDGGRVGAQRTQHKIQQLEQTVEQQQQMIDQLLEQLIHYEDQLAKRRPQPAIR